MQGRGITQRIGTFAKASQKIRWCSRFKYFTQPCGVSSSTIVPLIWHPIPRLCKALAYQNQER